MKEVENELLKTDRLTTQVKPLPFNEWSLDFLADYIVQVHHSYVKKTLPDIWAYSHKVMNVHGDRHPELHLVDELVVAIHTELTEHLMKEEQILFPYIKSLVASGNGSVPLPAAHFGTVGNPVKMMEAEHETVGKFLSEIRSITDNYTLPVDACASYRLLFGLLSEFEEDLHVHIHLENNILFPKAIELEKSLRK